MAKFVTIKHSSHPDGVTGSCTERAFERYYSKKGWEKVGDAPATVTITNAPSPTVSEQVSLLQTSPEKLQAALAPSSDQEQAAADDNPTTSAKRGGSK